MKRVTRLDVQSMIKQTGCFLKKLNWFKCGNTCWCTKFQHALKIFLQSSRLKLIYFISHRVEETHQVSDWFVFRLLFWLQMVFAPKLVFCKFPGVHSQTRLFYFVVFSLDSSCIKWNLSISVISASPAMPANVFLKLEKCKIISSRSLIARDWKSCSIPRLWSSQWSSALQLGSWSWSPVWMRSRISCSQTVVL